jgi:hypothetical protein
MLMSDASVTIPPDPSETSEGLLATASLTYLACGWETRHQLPISQEPL